MKEIWKDVVGFEGLYMVSNLGRIKSVERYMQNHSKLQLVPERIKSQRVGTNGYLHTDLYKNNKQTTVKIHRVVAEAFIDNPDNKGTVNHKDGNKYNNCVDNLEWMTQSEQNFHFYKKNLKSKSNIDKAVKAMNTANSKKVMCLNTGVIYDSQNEAGRCIGVSSSRISISCKNNKYSAGKDKEGNKLYWKYVDE